MKWSEELEQLRQKKTYIERAITALERMQALSNVERATRAAAVRTSNRKLEHYYEELWDADHDHRR